VREFKRKKRRGKIEEPGLDLYNLVVAHVYISNGRELVRLQIYIMVIKDEKFVYRFIKETHADPSVHVQAI